MLNRLQLITREDLVAAAKQAGGTGTSAAQDQVYHAPAREFEVKAEGDPADRRISIRISTTAQDRQNDTVAALGWKLANYRKNPVVLYGHDYRGLPIARDEGITTDELGLIGHPRFTPPELNPFGAMVHGLLLGGFLNAASVGFAPLKWTFNEETHGIDFLEQELLEYSIVPVPANAECLVEARDAGIDLAPLKAYAEEILSREHGSGLWMPKEKAEQLLTLLSPRKIVVPRAITPEFVTNLSIPGVVFELAATQPIVDGTSSPDVNLTQVQVKDGESTDTPTAPAAPAEEPAPVAQADGDPGDSVLELAEEPEDKGLVFELVEDEPAAGDGVIELDVDDATLRSVIGDAFDHAVERKFAALTGHLG